MTIRYSQTQRYCTSGVACDFASIPSGSQHDQCMKCRRQIAAKKTPTKLRGAATAEARAREGR